MHEMQAFEEASGREVKYNIKPRRPGDAAAVWAATETAEKVPQSSWSDSGLSDPRCR